MATVTTSLAERAANIFSNMGYVVERDGRELRAERKWRTVQVTPVEEPGEAPESGDLRCFVTWRDRVGDLRDQVAEADPGYDWAVIGIADDGDDYEVRHGPSARLST